MHNPTQNRANQQLSNNHSTNLHDLAPTTNRELVQPLTQQSQIHRETIIIEQCVIWQQKSVYCPQF